MHACRDRFVIARSHPQHPNGGSIVDATIAEMVRDKLDTGVLPLEVPARIWAGQGTGLACEVCEQPILETEIEYEAQYEEHHAIRLHSRCHTVWRQEVRRRGD